jgi:hypothetical protein
MRSVKKTSSSLLFLIFIILATVKLAADPLVAQQQLVLYNHAQKSNFNKVAPLLTTPLGKAASFLTTEGSFGPAAGQGRYKMDLAAGAGWTPLFFETTTVLAGFEETDAETFWVGQLPEKWSEPLWNARAHLGLPGLGVFTSADLGVRLGFLNRNSATAGSARLARGTLEFRGNILESGLMMPITITLYGAAHYMETQYRSGVLEQQINSATSGGALISGNVSWLQILKMRNLAASAGVVLSRKIGWFAPYAGIGLQVQHGDSVWSLKREGIVSATVGTDTVYSCESLNLEESSWLDPFEIRSGVGLEMKYKLFYIVASVEHTLLGSLWGGSLGTGIRF